MNSQQNKTQFIITNNYSLFASSSISNKHKSQWTELDGKVEYLNSLVGDNSEQLVFNGFEHLVDSEQQLNLNI